MRFWKFQGCGNDYVYVDCFREKPPADLAALSRAISDRHFGVGGDGLILIGPSDTADARMRMFNQDGSEAEMCGNGLRCVAKYVYDHDIARKRTLRIETGRGILTAQIEKSDGRVDKTLLLLIGQERERVSIVADRDTVSVAAGFDSGLNFVKLLGLAGGMPTRVAVPRSRLPELLTALGVDVGALESR